MHVLLRNRNMFSDKGAVSHIFIIIIIVIVSECNVLEGIRCFEIKYFHKITQEIGSFRLFIEFPFRNVFFFLSLSLFIRFLIVGLTACYQALSLTRLQH